MIHERLRLGIISALAANESLTFSDLKNLMNTTDGNLSVHARKLEDAGYISCSKFFEGRLPKTEYKLTAAGPHCAGELFESHGIADQADAKYLSDVAQHICFLWITTLPAPRLSPDNCSSESSFGIALPTQPER